MDSLTITSLTGVSGAVFTLALVWVVRQALDLPPETWKRVAPALALIVGVGWNWLAFLALQPENIQPWLVVLFGVLSGLAASGAWSSAKNAVIEPREAADSEAAALKRMERYVPHG